MHLSFVIDIITIIVVEKEKITPLISRNWLGTNTKAWVLLEAGLALTAKNIMFSY